MPSRERRNNALAGGLLMVGAIVIAVAVQLPWIRVSGPSVRISFKDLVEVGVVPSITDTGSTAEDRQLLLGSAAAMAVLGLLLMLTRVRFLGPLLRIVSIAVAFVPALLAGALWSTIGDSPSDALSDPEASVVARLGVVVSGVAQNAGLLRIEPDAGLYALTAGAAAAIIGCLWPARREPPMYASPA